MNRWTNLLMIGTFLLSTAGCNLCCGPHDFDYPTFGGKHQRVDPTHGRLGSIYSDPNLVAGPTADSNLTTGEMPLRRDRQNRNRDDEFLEEINRDNEFLEELDRDLDNVSPEDQLPSPAADDDETTAARTWKDVPLRENQRWR